MAIPENQLDTWASQGAVAGSRDTYAGIKGVLEDEESPYAERPFHVFLQGSYKNDTNVFAESDVDVVIRLDSIFYYDISSLSGPDQATLRERFGVAEYSLQTFKTEVIGWLRDNYGTDIELGSKAVTIAARGNRRKADVLICAMHRTYFPQGFMAPRYMEGVKFVTVEGQWVTNYPVQHSDNLTVFHQERRQWLKPTIRIFKNMRNRMVADGLFQSGVAPSYFIEGMLSNVPDAQFGPNYGNTVLNSLRWLWNTDRTDLWCANRQHRLTGENSPTSWPQANCTGFLRSAGTLWDTWR